VIRLDNTILLEHEDWGPGQTLMGHAMSGHVAEVIVHHSYIPSIPPGQTLRTEISAMQSMDRYHFQQGWGGFGYGFGLFQSGHAFLGRGLRRTGAHTAGRNSKSLGIVFVTDGSVHSLSLAALAAFKDIIAYAIRVNNLTANFAINPHDKYANKVCPGSKVKAQIPQLTDLLVKSWPNLRLGDRGPAVEYLQRFLVAVGKMPEGYPFGFFGTVTNTAVRKFQAANNLVVDGIVGPQTWQLVP
jgi:hypothetical protein